VWNNKCIFCVVISFMLKKSDSRSKVLFSWHPCGYAIVMLYYTHHTTGVCIWWNV
jgi:hypothetical protein